MSTTRQLMTAAAMATLAASAQADTVALWNFNSDLRHSNTSSRYETVQYTLDGTHFMDAATFTGDHGDTWFNGRNVDLSLVAGADNNAHFGVRIVASFAPGTSDYLASESGSRYGSAGTRRFDMVTLSGHLNAVPEPSTTMLVLAGLAVLGFLARRHKPRS